MIASSKCLLTALIVILLLSSCNLKDKVPNNLPSPKEMAGILADIHMVENAMNIENVSIQNKQLGYFKDILEKHQITQAVFDSALVWYSAHPDVYLKVYDGVIEILTEREALVRQEIKENGSKVNDSLVVIKDLWKLKRSYSLPKRDSIDNQISFAIDVDSLKNGKIKLSAWYTYKKDDVGKRDELMLITCYADSTRDTLRTNIVKAFTRVNASVTQSLKKDTAVVKLVGYLLYHEKVMKRHLSIEQISLEHIPHVPQNQK